MTRPSHPASHPAISTGPALLALLLASLAGTVGCSNSSLSHRARASFSVAPPIPDPQSVSTLAATPAPTLPPDPFENENASSFWRSGHNSSADFPTTYAGVIGAGERSTPTRPFLTGDIANPDLPILPLQSHSARPDGAENLRQVSFAHEGADFDPVLSRSGETLYFASTAHSPTSDIFSKGVDGKAITQLTSDPANDAMPALSPDGTRIAFASNRAGNWDLYIMAATGGQAIQITSDSAHELHPTWSPDGSMLAYCRLGEASQRWEIWVTEVDKPAVRRFLTQGLFPDWHPTLNKLLFQRSRDRGDRFFSIWTIDYINGDAQSPTMIASSDSAAIINPRWSSDGAYIACATVPAKAQSEPSGRPAQADIWIMKPDGSARANLTAGQNLNLMPTWAPDNSVFFVSDRAGPDNIWATNSRQAFLAASSTPPSLAPIVATLRPPLASAPAANSPAQTALLHKPAPLSRPNSPSEKSPQHAPDPDLPPEMANVPTDIPDNRP